MISAREELDSVLEDDIDTEESKSFSILEIVNFTKSAFRPRDFGKVERLLRSREEEMKIDKERLEFYRSRCSELEMELKKKKNDHDPLEDRFGGLEFRKLAIEDDLKKYKRTSDELKEQITRLEEDNQIVLERERRTEERIAKLIEELKKTEQDGKEKIVQLKTENRDLECAKRRAETEIEVWKKRFAELEWRVLRLEEDTAVLASREAQLPEKIKVDLGSFLSIVCNKEKGKAETSRGIQKVSKQVNDEQGSASLTHSQTKDRIMNCDETLQKPAGVGYPLHSGVNGSGGLQDTAVSPSIDIPCKPFLNIKEEDPQSICTETKMEFGNCARKNKVFDDERSSKEKAALSTPSNFRPASEGIIEISDSDDEADNAVMSTFDIRGNGTAYISTARASEGGLGNEKEMASEKCLKRTCLDDCRGVKKESNNEEKFPLTSTAKRKRVSRMITSDSEGDDDDDDKLPIGKLKMKKVEELINEPLGSHVKQVSLALTVPSRGDNVDDVVPPSRRHMVTLKLCGEKKEGAENNSAGHIETRATEYDLGCSTIGKAEGNGAEEVGSDHEDGKLRRFLVNGSDDSSDSEDSSFDSEDIADEIISRIRRARESKSKWNFETEMLTSFSKDLELCMKAVCALYRQQISEKKFMKGSLYSNKRGFDKLDALRGTMLAKFLTDGDPQGELKKSVKELQQFDPRALDECRMLACEYYKQLFEIYQNKEDPLFLPL